MRSEITCEDFARMLNGSIKAIKDNHEALSRLDTAIGDGDHGVTMLRAMKGVAEVLSRAGLPDEKTASSPDFSSLVHDVGWSLLNCDGGSTGPLFGSFFLGMADAIHSDQLDGPALAAAFEAGLESLRQQTRANLGDKTLLDALIPAVLVLRAAAGRGESIEAILHAAAEAAREGAESTRPMQARFGRARNLGERTIGHQDPGATSIFLLFQGFSTALEKQPFPPAGG